MCLEVCVLKTSRRRINLPYTKTWLYFPPSNKTIALYLPYLSGNFPKSPLVINANQFQRPFPRGFILSGLHAQNTAALNLGSGINNGSIPGEGYNYFVGLCLKRKEEERSRVALEFLSQKVKLGEFARGRS